MTTENIFTEEETAALEEMRHLEKGYRLSYEGAVKWKSFNSHNQIDALISQDIQELRKTPAYKNVMNKIHMSNNVPAGMYD